MPHRREQLAGLLWSDTSDDNVHRNLRQELWRLRKVLGVETARKPSCARPDEYLLAEERTIAFNPDAPAWLDMTQLMRPAV